MEFSSHRPAEEKPTLFQSAVCERALHRDEIGWIEASRDREFDYTENATFFTPSSRAFQESQFG
jgi:hypothetical protein